MQQYPGDQDFISETISQQQVRLMDPTAIRSWRWEVLDGGIDPMTGQYRSHGSGAVVPDGTSILVFHGKPKPHDINDSMLYNVWAGINNK
jgi:hypothetical protein